MRAQSQQQLKTLFRLKCTCTIKKRPNKAYIALLQGVLGSVEEVRSVSRPDPLVLGGFVFLLVGKLKPEQTSVCQDQLR